MITIIETQQFISEADKIINAAEKDELFDLIARNPKKGAVCYTGERQKGRRQSYLLLL